MSGGGLADRRSHTLNDRLFSDFVRFSQRQYDCLDYDPFHPMIVELGRGLPTEAALWLSVMYMAYYNVGSAWVAFCAGDPLRPLPDWCVKLPVGVQRRNLRGGRVATHLNSCIALAKQAGSLEKYLTGAFVGDVRKDWSALKAALDGIWGNGRWSTYTTAELIQKANKLPVLPWEIMNDGSSGPRAGLGRLYGQDALSTTELDQLADGLFALVGAEVRTKIYYLPRGHYDHAMLESQLCDFNSMLKGRYYVGRDIDRDQERIVYAERALRVLRQSTAPLQRVWEVRAKVFDKDYLGEYQNKWMGRTEYANTYYQRVGQVASHKEILARLKGVLF